MSEFKAKTDKPLKFDIQEIWDENSCLIEDDVFSLSMVAGKSILGRADFTRAITPLLTAYTTTVSELETVKAELGRGKWVSVSELLPETNEDVLIWNETMPKAKISWYGKGCGEWGGKNIPVTFWMPIHELPI